MAADIIHKGHINILKKASKLGFVIVGLLTDNAILSYKNFPHLKYRERKVIIENIRFVDKVIPQKTLDYSQNLKKIKPHFVVHGDDWKKGVQKNTRKMVIQLIKRWSGVLIEVKYTKNISSSMLKKRLFKDLKKNNE